MPPRDTAPLATRADPSALRAALARLSLEVHPEVFCLSRHSDSFRCRNCRLDVPMAAPGTQHRNHCPNCLWSRHVDDDVPGDRAADCSASMEPIGVSVRDDGEWALVHRCTACSTVHVNRIAGDDNPLMLMRLAVKPLAQPPFPLEWLIRV